MKLLNICSTYKELLTEKIERDIRLTLNNGGLPFIISVDGDDVSIYKYELKYSDVDKVFDGSDNGGDKDASMLLKLKNSNKYVFIGDGNMYEFDSNDTINSFSSPIGNSAVPYPFSIGEKYVYFMLDKVCVDKHEFKGVKNLYDRFYEKKDELKLINFKKLKNIIIKK